MAGQINPLQAKLDMVSLDIQEPLAESAPLARQWSETLCRGCGSYHGAWQTLRLLGVLNSMRSDDDFLVTQLDIAIGGGARKILISGAADYALQARVAAVAKRHKITPRLTIADLCETPLKLNRWYATRTGMDVDIFQGNILNYRKPDHFDLVCTHSFLPFFNMDERRKLLGVWWDCLSPGGAVLTAQRTRPSNTSSRHGFTDAQADALGQRAYDRAEEQFDRLGIAPKLARRLAVDYATGRSTYVFRDSEQ
ncbi:MAG: class I SAM-dependent methyltransferase, partial [Lysobacterales bacterium]